MNNIGVDKNKIEVIYNPVYVDKIRSKVNIKRRNGSFKYSYLASGRLIKQKGFDRLIESFVSYPDSHLIVMGDGPELEKLDDIVSINNLQSRVTFIGHQDNPWEWYAGADVLLVSSHWEGMSNAVLEALACGCPVVATPEAGGIEDVKMLSSNDAVTIVQFGDKFVKSAMDIGKRYYSNESTSSLLPEEFDVDNAVCNYEKLFVYLYKKANP